MKNTKLLLFVGLMVISNGFLFSSTKDNQSNPFGSVAEKIAIRERAKDFFEIAQNCANPEIVNKKIKDIAKKANNSTQLLYALNQQNPLKETPEMVALKQAAVTKSVACANVYVFFRQQKADIEAQMHSIATDLESKQNLINAGFEIKEENNQGA